MASAATMIGDPGLGGATRQQYAIDVLTGIGAPITAGNVAAIETWITHESGGRTGFAFNPLNSTDHPFGSAGQGGSQGNIQRYSNYQQGVATIVHQLLYPNHGYPAIVAAFRSDAGSAAVLRAVNASDWGTHNFSAAELGGGVPGGAGTVAGSPSAPGAFQTAGITDFGQGLLNLGGDAAGGLGGLILGGGGNNPVTKGATSVTGAIGDAIGAAGSVAELAARVVNLFLNWHYLAEVVIGTWMVWLGVKIVTTQVTGTTPHLIPNSVKQGAAAAPMVVAAA